MNVKVITGSCASLPIICLFPPTNSWWTDDLKTLFYHPVQSKPSAECLARWIILLHHVRRPSRSDGNALFFSIFFLRFFKSDLRVSHPHLQQLFLHGLSILPNFSRAFLRYGPSESGKVRTRLPKCLIVSLHLLCERYLLCHLQRLWVHLKSRKIRLQHPTMNRFLYYLSSGCENLLSLLAISLFFGVLHCALGLPL